MSAAQGTAREIACFGARGDGKSWAALWAMVYHAIEHHNAGYGLPTLWLGLRDTFQNHKLTTHKSLMGRAWPATAKWNLSEAGMHATFKIDGVPFVELELIGADSPGDAEKVRTECHGLWVDEPAPAMGVSNGLTDDLYFMACSSQRLETHARVALVTSNYPDSEHWVWQRFVENPQPGTQYFRIPPGERASADYRAELERLYATRPDLARRLVLGQPGAVVLGAQVAVGFSRERHVRRAEPVSGVPVWIGQDGGHTPTSVMGQRVEGRCRIIGSVSSEHDGMRGHLTNLLLPWLSEHVPWVLEHPDLCYVRYDPSIETGDQSDIETDALRVMRRLLPGRYQPGPVTWNGRKDPMLSLFNALHHGEPVLEIDPVSNKGLIRALDGGWFYPTAPDGRVAKADTAHDSVLPKKPNHPHEDYGDAFCYLVAGMAPLTVRSMAPKGASKTAFDPYTYTQPKPKTKSWFSPLWSQR